MKEPDMEKEAEDNYEKIKEEVKDINNYDGRVNLTKLWKTLKQLSPKFVDPPTAVFDVKGNLMTTTDQHFTKILAEGRF